MAYNPQNPNGQNTMANSQPVVVASDQSDLPVNIDKVGATALVLGQANATLSVPVVLPASQITTLTPPAAITNYANETGGNLAAAKSDLDTIAGAISSAKMQTNITNASLPVTGTFFQSTQPVSGTFWQTTQPVSGTFWQTTQPVSQSGTWNVGSSPNSALADGTANPTTNIFGSLNELFNGSTWDRVRSLSAYNLSSGASGVGIQASGMLGQYNTSLPAANSGYYYVPQLTAKAQMMTVMMDAAGNNRGANVNASNQLSVSIDNFGPASIAVTQSGAWNVGLTSSTVTLNVNVQNTVPVSGTFWQATQPVSGTFWQTTQPISLTTLSTVVNLGQLGGTTPTFTGSSLNVDVTNTVPVSGTFWQATQPISLTTLSTVVNVAQLGGTAPTYTSGNLNVEVANASIPVTGTFWQTTQPVSGTVTANAGTGTLNVSVQNSTLAVTESGTWTVQPGNTPNTTPWLTTQSPATSGGLSIYSGSITTTVTAIKTSAGQLYGWHIFNANATTIYVQIFNVATGSVTLGTTAPTMALGIPAGGGANVMTDSGIAFATAISVACTTTRTGSTAPASSVDLNFFYK